MGWNQGYTVMQETVVGVYDALAERGERLERHLLDALMEPYRGTDIDSGGDMGLRTLDGKSVEEIVVLIHDGKLPPEPPEDSHLYPLGERFHTITRAIYGWA